MKSGPLNFNLTLGTPNDLIIKIYAHAVELIGIYIVDQSNFSKATTCLQDG